jgi:hypothetical protein
VEQDDGVRASLAELARQVHQTFIKVAGDRRRADWRQQHVDSESLLMRPPKTRQLAYESILFFTNRVHVLSA